MQLALNSLFLTSTIPPRLESMYFSMFLLKITFLPLVIFNNLLYNSLFLSLCNEIINKTEFSLNFLNFSLSRKSPLVYKYGAYLSALGFVPFFLFQLSVFIEQLNIYLFALPLGAVFFPESSLTVKEALRYILGLG